ncbi:hypothetical protein PILCRDRAFT_579232 [Piloderma croceum F 1598]|uniref:Uncharacterized protein n=1 Tax=Piloderma croceum (strain F 1598) TaxID=765440 RepID=A0A0C3F279_PILCF|nr:hypothetical protein PILCRDRAFT_579232 [Piloderma croceum F 1598]
MTLMSQLTAFFQFTFSFVYVDRCIYILLAYVSADLQAHFRRVVFSDAAKSVRNITHFSNTKIHSQLERCLTGCRVDSGLTMLTGSYYS